MVERTITPARESAAWRESLISRILLWGGLAFLVLFIAYNPADAADVVRALGNGLVNMAQGFGDIVGDMFG